MTKKDIVDAWARIRTIDQSIPDEVLDFMKDAAFEKLDPHINRPDEGWYLMKEDKVTYLHILTGPVHESCKAYRIIYPGEKWVYFKVDWVPERREFIIESSSANHPDDPRWIWNDKSKRLIGDRPKTDITKVYGIGKLEITDDSDNWRMKQGPTPILQKMLNLYGCTGDYIVDLGTIINPNVTKLYFWDEAKYEWAKVENTSEAKEYTINDISWILEHSFEEHTFYTQKEALNITGAEGQYILSHASGEPVSIYQWVNGKWDPDKAHWV